MKADKHQRWFERFRHSAHFASFTEKPIAYFCAEYALSAKLPTYAGGLGILAGDMVAEAGAQQLPILFVGLRYQKGQHDAIPHSVRFHLPTSGTLTLARDKDNFPILLSIPLDGRIVRYQAWLWQDGNAKAYLLDTDVPENDERDRRITEQLYVEDRELRLKQELILGIGGHRFLAALGQHPSVYHLNEGHSAFLALELIHHEMQHQHVDFKTACIYAKQHLLFTNHTIVMAGQELFTKELIARVLADYAKETNLAITDITDLGTMENSAEAHRLFSMTMFSFRLSSIANAVSVLHQKKARELWPAYPMEAITNGIHLPNWDAIKDDDTIVKDHTESKRKLLAYIKQETGVTWSDDMLLFGWGRRLVPYKQPFAFLADAKRLRALATNSAHPFRIVFSGPTSAQGVNELADQLQAHIKNELGDIAVFLPHYSIPIAQLMTAGCDVWLNTPVVGSEACGTSGMKAALNGTLPLSTRDGWVAEADLRHTGWVVGQTEHLTNDLLSIVEHDIAPSFYKPRSHWKRAMERARALITKDFSMTRALRDYIERGYLPLLKRKHTHKFN